MTKRHRRGTRFTPKGASGAPHTRQAREEESELAREIRRGVRDPSPIALLSLASSFVEMSTPRPSDRFVQREERLDQARLVQSFVGVDAPEGTAMLAALAPLVTDVALNSRMRAELARRRHVLPHWLRTIEAVEVSGVRCSRDVLRDGENLMIGVRWPEDERGQAPELTVVVFLDHNFGSKPKDAFLLPTGIDATLSAYRAAMGADGGVEFPEIDPADARVWIEEGIRRYEMTVPPHETETWPLCRPTVEWVVRMLPEGGREYPRVEYEPDDRERIAAEFLASPAAAAVPRDPDTVELLDTLLWYGTDYGCGDPYMWSPVRIEILLADWAIRKQIGSTSVRRRLPNLLRAFIPWAHAQRGITARLTDEALAAVDEWEPEFQDAIGDERRPQGAAALAQAVLDQRWADDDGSDGPEPFDLDRYRQLMHAWIVERVGGEAELAALDAEPLPDEPLDERGVPLEVLDRYRHIASLVDGCCDALLDVEYRTIARRILFRLAMVAPRTFTRPGRDENLAASIVWIACRANGAFDQGDGLRVKDIIGYFGLSGSSLSDRGNSLCRTLGFTVRPSDVLVETVELLHSRARADILHARDEIAGSFDQEA